MSQDFTSLVCRKRSKRPCIEPRILEAKTAVHAVGRQLECLLLDIILGRRSHEAQVDIHDYKVTCSSCAGEADLSFIKDLTCRLRFTSVAISRGRTP